MLVNDPYFVDPAQLVIGMTPAFRGHCSFVVLKTILITITQNGAFIFTLNQITQTRKLKTVPVLRV